MTTRTLIIAIDVDADNELLLSRGDAPKVVIDVVASALAGIGGSVRASVRTAHWDGAAQDAPRTRFKPPSRVETPSNDPKGFSGGLPPQGA